MVMNDNLKFLDVLNRCLEGRIYRGECAVNICFPCRDIF